MKQVSYDVVISYSRYDYLDAHDNVIPGNEVSKIIEALIGAGITYWMDKKREGGVLPGNEFAEIITKHIKACKILVYISSTAANQSEWTKREIAYAVGCGKKIIPLLLDDSPYQDSVGLLINGLDKINYYTNPKKGLEDMIEAINTHRDKLLEEERLNKEQEERQKEIEQKKSEDERRRREVEEQHQKELQRQIVENIHTSVKELNIEESKLDLERRKLLVKTEKVTDIEQRNSLKIEIMESSPIRKKTQDEIKKLQDRVAELEAWSLPRTRQNKRVHIVNGCIIFILISVICFLCFLLFKNNNSKIVPTEQNVADSIVEFCVNNVKFNMIWAEGGSFYMGSQNSNRSGHNYDRKSKIDESPVHEVTVNSFYIGETVVTQALWMAVLGSEPTDHGGWQNWFGKGDDYPAYCVSYEKIVDVFIPKLNQLTGKNFRLPTEAEWEYTAKGGKKRDEYKYAGSKTIRDVAWYLGNSHRVLHPVKEKVANGLGVFDMSGNVYEWCQDWYGVYNSASQVDPQGPSSSDAHKRVLRGGSWGSPAKECRVSERYFYTPNTSVGSIGFRLALSQ